MFQSVTGYNKEQCTKPIQEEIPVFSRIEGSFIATANIPDAATAFHGEPLSLLFGMCAGAMEFNNRVFLYRHDEPVRVNLNWIRDYILTLKGFR